MTCSEQVSSALPSRPQQPESAPASEIPVVDPHNPHPVRKHRVGPALADRADRTSFSSTKESNTGVAQSFTDSKTSSYLRWEIGSSGSEDAIDDGSSIGSEVESPVERLPEEPIMLNPQSTLHGLVCPCDSFRGWKNISIGGKVASKSFGDLRRLAMRWDWETSDDRGKKVVVPLLSPTGVKKIDGTFLPGQSPFERLPMELLGEFSSFSPNMVSELRIWTLFCSSSLAALVTWQVQTGHMICL